METVKPTVKAGLLIAIGFVLLGVSVLSAVWLMMLEQDAAERVEHTLEVENRVNRLGMMITRAVARERGYLLSGRQSYLDDYRATVAELPTGLADLEYSTRDNPVQRRNVAALKSAVAERLDELDDTLRLHLAGRREEALAIVATDRGQVSMTRIETLLGRMHEEEDRLLDQRRQTVAGRTVLALSVLAVSSLLIVLLAILARVANQRYIAELKERHRLLKEEVAAHAQSKSQVRQLQKMEAVGQLTGGIAHDFNNMLAIIVGSLDLARRRLSRGDTPGIVKAIDHAQEGAQRAVALTAQLLAFSRSQALAPRVVEPNRLVAGISELLRRTLEERVEIETVLAGGLWRVFADSGQIENALVNLALNARDAMPEGGKLTIETANSELDDRYARLHEEVTPGQYVMLSITDTGTGMEKDVIERAFEPFYSTKGVGRGTGLGLSQVFGFVKQSSGHIKIYSEVGKGTTIKIYLPRYVGDQEPAPTAASSDDVPRGKPGELILVVEDDEQVRAISVGMLRELGYDVAEAGNGAEALALLDRNGQVALMFTDVVMPGLTGRALADEARTRHPGLRVLYTTGYTRNSIVHNGVVDHDVALIQKPFSVGDLARKVRAMLDA